VSDALLTFVLRLGDNALVQGQRMTECVTREPELEEELANANFALDYVGQARLFYQYAAELDGGDGDEDFYAFRRDAQAFQNFLLLEQPNGDFGDQVVRQFLFEAFYLELLAQLVTGRDRRLAEIAVRAEKEIRYHLRHARAWLVRLGDGTDESHARVQASLERYWRYAGEFFAVDDSDTSAFDALGIDGNAAIETPWREAVAAAIAEATLETPDVPWIRRGGRQGEHSEHLGYLVAEMQHLQRAYPEAAW
jgi:ring-1,2-phenylacetyl-CoA epoxidase subunit PaaC